MALNTVEALFKMDISPCLDGVDYIETAMKLYEKNNAPFTNMKLAYVFIAKEHNTTSEKVMHDISMVIDYAFKCGERPEVIKYFGLTRRSNGNHLAVLYQRLKEEESGRNKNK